jgi:hypothetical protein
MKTLRGKRPGAEDCVLIRADESTYQAPISADVEFVITTFLIDGTWPKRGKR